ncbi:hypothetical protein F4553_005466 [Allocatelliglobosispora scoriae]|uniref:Uncharacterized protein n=1 Tax=Allocatelliglobosispora scoriae TaxID=643052 RepID=A0A841BYZ9_9ACTN|nr:hypothetical protein [Allocatelliglobosispora scoriae]MBB5872032.1 hypothetical protein [Allocatelliglobosispora scoriae]
MPAPLTAADARTMADLAPSPWLRQAVAPVLFVLGAVNMGVAVTVVKVLCSEANPCRTEPLDPIVSGLFVGLLPLAWISLRSTAVTAVLLSIGELVLGGSTDRVPPPSWIYAVSWSYVVVCVVAAVLVEGRRRDGGWPERVGSAKPPEPGQVPRIGTVSLVSGAVLVGLVGVLIAVFVVVQARGEARERAAEVVRAPVVGHVGVDVMVERSGELERVHVYNPLAYPVGSTMALRVDDDGLLQPVAEPYDAGGWLMLAALLAPTGAGLLLRTRRRRRDLARVFAEPSPVTGVFVHSGEREIVIYPADAVAGSAPILAMRVQPHAADESVAAAIQAGRYDPQWHHYPARPAELFGVPVAGRWCAIVVGDRLVVPVGPLTTTASTARFIPPYPWWEGSPASRSGARS